MTPTPKDEAIRFVTKLVDDTALLRAYLAVLDEVANDPDSEDTSKVDDFLTSKGYATTADQVVAAQAIVEGEQIAYWCGIYSTSLVAADNSKTTGPSLTINPQVSGMHQIGYGLDWLIEPVFSGNTLVWASKDADGTDVNDTSGELVFTRTNLENGSFALGFSGTVTDAGGKRQLLGVQGGADKPPADTPPGQDFDLMKTVLSIVPVVVAVLGLGTVIVTIVKGRLEMKKLKLEIDKLSKDGKNADAKQLADNAAQKESENKQLEGYAAKVVDQANDKVESLPPKSELPKVIAALKVDRGEIEKLQLPDLKISNESRQNLNSVIQKETGTEPGAGPGAPKELEEGGLDEQLEKVMEEV